MFDVAGRTHPGRVRQANQDAFIADSRLNVHIVADGMGGHAGGEVAATIAVQSVHDFVRTSAEDSTITWPAGFEPASSFEANQLRNAVRVAHRHIKIEGRRNPELSDMGSTIAVLIVRNGRLTCTNIGDSRVYLMRRGTLTQLSVDHSWAAAALRDGAAPEAVRADRRGNMLLHALGADFPNELPLREGMWLEDGDVLLLSTDGLHGVVGDEALGETLGRDEAAGKMADRLIDMANASGGPDNITAIVGRYVA